MVLEGEAGGAQGRSPPKEGATQLGYSVRAESRGVLHLGPIPLHQERECLAWWSAGLLEGPGGCGV